MRIPSGLKIEFSAGLRPGTLRSVGLVEAQRCVACIRGATKSDLERAALASLAEASPFLVPRRLRNVV